MLTYNHVNIMLRTLEDNPNVEHIVCYSVGENELCFDFHVNNKRTFIFFDESGIQLCLPYTNKDISWKLGDITETIFTDISSHF